MQDESADNGKSAEELIADAEALLSAGALDDSQDTIEDEQEEESEGQDEQSAIPKPEDEDEDHSEKSRLGRKLKRLEQEQSRKEAELQAKLDRIESLLTKSVLMEDDDPEPELSEFVTRDELKAHDAWKDRQFEKRLNGKEKAEKDAIFKYQIQYKELLDEIDQDEDPDLFSMLTDTKDTTYNLSHSNFQNAAKDFAKNLSAAQRALRLESKRPTPNVKGKSGTVATGVGVSNSKATKTFDRDKYLKGLSRDEASIASNLSDSDLRRIFG